MTQDEIIEIAQECKLIGMRPHLDGIYSESLVAFANLVAAKALAQTQEPVAWMWDVNNGAGYSSRGIGFYQTDIPFAKHTPLYTTPPAQRTWVGLTDEDMKGMSYGDKVLATWVARTLKEKNT